MNFLRRGIKWIHWINWINGHFSRFLHWINGHSQKAPGFDRPGQRKGSGGGRPSQTGAWEGAREGWRAGLGMGPDGFLGDFSDFSGESTHCDRLISLLRQTFLRMTIYDHGVLLRKFSSIRWCIDSSENSSYFIGNWWVCTIDISCGFSKSSLHQVRKPYIYDIYIRWTTIIPMIILWLYYVFFRVFWDVDDPQKFSADGPTASRKPEAEAQNNGWSWPGFPDSGLAGFLLCWGAF